MLDRLESQGFFFFFEKELKLILSHLDNYTHMTFPHLYFVSNDGFRYFFQPTFFFFFSLSPITSSSLFVCFLFAYMQMFFFSIKLEEEEQYFCERRAVFFYTSLSMFFSFFDFKRKSHAVENHLAL